MSDNYIDELKYFFDKNDIPAIEKKEITFLGIADQPHYENVISNIYAFFLNPYEQHQLDDLFISSLLILVKQKAKENNLQKDISLSRDFEIIREKGIEGRKRIDLLINDNDNVIIIENKIYHELNNPLGEYWNSKKIPQVLEENKIGIVLSLWKKNTNHENFINITHIEWLNKISENIKSYEKEETLKYIIFLKDLHQNIKNLTNNMKKEQIDFYKNNLEKVNKAVELKFAFRDHIIRKVERVCDLLEHDLLLDKVRNQYNKKILRYYRSKKNKNLVITVIFGDILTETGELYIIVELQHGAMKIIQNKYDEITKDLEGTLNNDFKDRRETWAHFAHIPNLKPNAEEIENLIGYIVRKIEEHHILDIFERLEKEL